MRTLQKLLWLTLGLSALAIAGCGGSETPSVGSGSDDAPIEDARGYVDDVVERVRADAREATKKAKEQLGSVSTEPDAEAVEPEAAAEPADAAPDSAGDVQPAADSPEPAEGSARPGAE